MSILKYKNYQGAASYEEGTLLIRLLHIDDFVAAECENASEVQSTFEELVDGYIGICRNLGKEPARPFKGSLNIRIAPELHRKAAMAATACDRTLNNWISMAIESRLEHEQASHQPLDAEAIRAVAARVRSYAKPAEHPSTRVERLLSTSAKGVTRVEQTRERRSSTWRVLQ